MKLTTALLRLLFVPTCPACRKLVRYDRDPRLVLCDACQQAWDHAIRAQCATCLQPYYDCRCVSSRMKSAHVNVHVKLVPYREDGAFSVVRRLLLNLKTKRSRAAFDFLARELEIGVANALRESEARREELGKTPLKTVITYLPRGKRNLRREGVDQAKELASALSKVLDLPLVHALSRRRDPVSQKTLGAKARAQNVAGAFAANGQLEAVRCLLVDDIVTTGASISEAARILRHAGAKEIIAVTVGGSKPTVLAKEKGA